ncbi:MAG: RepB family plasmid replication initiator protein [Chlamydiae bacterium]|nr:RepB family plasmid replication initiator protein [Chlamydiota bacterium]
MSIEKTDEIVVQSNRLIEAHYRLGLQEKRLILWLIKEIGRNDTDFKKYELKISDFAEMMGLCPDTQYKEMKRVTKALITRPIEVENPETKATMQMAWLCFAHWEPKKGMCHLEFHPKLKPYLLGLKGHFTEIGFSEFLGLKSIYSVRMFEILIQYESIGKRTISIENLRSWCGLSPDEYPFYADVKRRIIDRAKMEINTKTGYEIDYREIKESRKVIELEWTIKKKTHFEKSQEEKSRIIQKELRSGNAIIQQLLEYGFTLPHSRKIVKDNDHETLVNAIKSVDIQVERGRAKNPKAMLVKAIQEKWHPEKFVDRKPKAS